MTTPTPSHRRGHRRAHLGLCALALLSACRGAVEQRPSVAELLAHAAYGEAYREAARLVEEQPGDPQRESDLERARVAYWLDEGRRLALEGDAEAALVIFDELAAQGAAPAAVEQWQAKCRRMISEERRLAGWELELAGDFDAAARLYREAVEYQPDDAFAAAGLERIEMLAAWRREQRNAYYNSGTRDLRNFALPEARRSFEAALKFLPGDEDAARRVTEVRRVQADERVRLGEQLAAEGHFHASLGEYRQAAELVPDLPGIDERIAAAELEVSVADGLSRAERALLAGEADAAIAILEEELARTAAQGLAVQTALDAARERRLEQKYETALALERDFDFPAAVAAYDALAEEAGGFYKDVLARRGTLASYMQIAPELYAEYEAAGDDAGRLSALRKIALFWPTYLDVPERLEELEQRVGAAR
jgi:tetratricopeptide (TPR) repeat protein